MITEVHIRNYRSIVEAKVKLSPFTLLIGANGAGKSNFLRLFEDLQRNPRQPLVYHINYKGSNQRIELFEKGVELYMGTTDLGQYAARGNPPVSIIFDIDPTRIGEPEPLTANPSVQADGTGAVQVLDTLKTGDKEELFDKIQIVLSRYVPEIKRLSFVPGKDVKQLQVREKHLKEPILVSDLSEGTRLVLTILTIIYQENPPELIGLEDLDRGMHPRLYQQMVELLFQIVEDHDVQIIATTHNPYLVDQFKDHEEAVVIVEKEDGATKFATLAERLKGLDPGEEPLGSLWYSGFVGGVPSSERLLS